MYFSGENFLESMKYGVQYLPETVKLTLIPFGIGLIVGFLIALARVYRIPVLSQVFTFLVTVYQGIPIIVALLIYSLLFTLHFNQIAATLHLELTVKDVDIIVVGYVALTLRAITIISETFRGAFMSIPINQYEAGYSVGLTKVQTLRRIIIGQVLPVSIPGLTNNLVGSIKSTSMVTAIGIVEVMAGAIIPCGITYSFVEGYVAAAVIYWIFSIILETILGQIEKHSKSFRRENA